MKNYTSTVPAERSIEEIEKALVRAGAKHISKEYSDGAVSAVSFTIMSPDSQAPIGIRLPASPDAVFQVLRKKKRHWRYSMEKSVREQSQRTAWRLMLDWVLVQLSLIEMRQAELLQVFMPYIWTGRGSFYESIKEQRFAALTYQPQEEAQED